MHRSFIILVGALTAFGIGAATSPELTADQIVDRYVEARGGIEAWRKIQTMAWTGHIESGPAGSPAVPFLMLFKRPNQTHYEVLMQNQKSLRIFDGSQGWKLRPTAQGAPEAQIYTPDEVSFARDACGLDGPLVDYKAKGVTVALRGTGMVEGHRAYRLQVTLPSGQSHDDWIDAQNFLELKYDRVVHDTAGQSGVVSVYYRNYQTIKGLVMPFTIETGGAATKATDRMIIEKFAINPTLDDAQFARPAVASRHRNGVPIDTRTPSAPA